VENEIAISTPAVARLLGWKPSAFSKALWDGRVIAPIRRLGGSYVWGIREITAASWALRHHSLSENELAQIQQPQEVPHGCTTQPPCPR
jgi:hypothetical protein